MSLAADLQRMHKRVGFDLKRHTYAVDGQALVSVTKVIEETVAKGPGFTAAAVKLARQGLDYRKEWAKERDKGTAVHAVIENWARNRLGLAHLTAPAVSPEAEYLAAGLPELLETAGIEPVFQPEVRLFHLRLGYAGTQDLPALWHGVPTVFDIKTTKRATDLWRSWKLQSAAYREALTENGCGDWLGAAIRVPKDGGKPDIVPFGDDPADREAWRNTLRLYRWLQSDPQPKPAPAPRQGVIDATERFLERQEG